MHTLTAALDVPGARLHHEVRGDGPLVVLLGTPIRPARRRGRRHRTLVRGRPPRLLAGVPHQRGHRDARGDDPDDLRRRARPGGPRRRRLQNAHLLRPTTHFRPDIDALRAGRTRIVVGIGRDSAGQLCDRSSRALADALGLEPTLFPGDHIGFAEDAAAFEPVLRSVLPRSG